MAALSLAARSSIASMATPTRAPAPVARTSLVVRASEAERRAANLDTRKAKTQLKHASIRHKIVGTAERPRLAVFRSSKHMHAQVIDDTANDGVGHTLAHMSTLNKQLAASLEKTGDKTAAMEVGKALGVLCKERGIDKVVFDRGGFMYHGRVAAVAEGAREAGLVF